MEPLRAFYQQVFFRPRLYGLWIGLIALFLLSYVYPVLLPLCKIAFMALLGLLVLDGLLLFLPQTGLTGSRQLPERFSNGDPHEIQINLQSQYAFPIRVRVIDEVPFQFQWRNNRLYSSLKAQGRDSLAYSLRPVKRGAYEFGQLQAYVSSPIGLLSRCYVLGAPNSVPTYPSYVQMRKYQWLAVSNRLNEIGIKRIRRLGHTTEFEQIKEYVSGDDYRTINWKATARANKLMVNQFTDERAQPVYCIIDKSRTMKMPFEGMSLLDYAINATLVLSSIAVYRQDHAGLITFAETVDTCLPARRSSTQMHRIQELLYQVNTRFLEADFERLYGFLKRQLVQRSLLVLFTNFESVTALHRQLPYLQKIARHHLLLVIFFENTELRGLLRSRPDRTEDIYIKAIGEHFAFEKQQVVKELEQHGIMVILTPPDQLTVNTLNKYLEIKARGMI